MPVRVHGGICAQLEDCAVRGLVAYLGAKDKADARVKFAEFFKNKDRLPMHDRNLASGLDCVCGRCNSKMGLAAFVVVQAVV